MVSKEAEKAEMERLAELKAKRKMESWSEQFKFLGMHEGAKPLPEILPLKRRLHQKKRRRSLM